MSDLAVDTLRGGASVQVMALDGFRTDTVRDPHRHDYHELIWIREGRGRHLIDGEPLPVVAGTITVIGRGQVHQFQEAEDVSGAVVRFGDEVLFGEGTPGWLVTARGGRRVTVSRGEQDRLDALIASLAAETSRPPDGRSAELERHLLTVILLWTERWYDAMRTERRAADDADVQLQRRFARQLEQDFTRHHDAAHYADGLRVPASALSKALSHTTGRSTKELITDRVMLEAARLLRFTELTIGEIAHRVGFDDQLYFSRAFKRHHGEPPMAYRARVRGKSMDR
jgi:AraC family transcriptional regulator, transcriptional activator of pobA